MFLLKIPSQPKTYPSVLTHVQHPLVTPLAIDDEMSPLFNPKVATTRDEGGHKLPVSSSMFMFVQPQVTGCRSVYHVCGKFLMLHNLLKTPISSSLLSTEQSLLWSFDKSATFLISSQTDKGVAKGGRS